MSQKITADHYKMSSVKDIISIALSIVYEVSHQEVESCTFDFQKARLFYKNKSFIDVNLNDIDDNQKSILTEYMVRI